VTKPATQKIKAKLEDRGRPGMFVGYADNHAKGMYRIMNIQMNRMLKSHDIIWTKKLYGEYKWTKVIPPTKDDDNTVISGSSIDSESGRDNKELPTGRENDAPAKPEPEDVVLDTLDEDSEEERDKTTPTEPVNPKLLREMKRLGAWFNPAASRTVTRASLIGTSSRLNNDQPGREVTETVDDTVNMIDRYSNDFAFSSLDVDLTAYNQIVEPKSYQEAWNHQEMEQKEMEESHYKRIQRYGH
jgi:hypothetical protein